MTKQHCPECERLGWVARALLAERQLAEAQAHVRNHHLEPCETCAANESERDALKAELTALKDRGLCAYCNEVRLQDKVTQLNAEVERRGAWAKEILGEHERLQNEVLNSRRLLGEPLTTSLRENETLKVRLEQAEAAARAGLDLSMWAATIKWDHRERNTAAWLEGLKARIERVQTLAAIDAGKEAGG